MRRSIRPKRARQRPHPRYRLGWGCVKSLAFTFGDSDQWAGVLSKLEVRPPGWGQLGPPLWYGGSLMARVMSACFAAR